MRGAPTKYNPEMVEQTRKLCEHGATVREVADFLEVSEQTVKNWSHVYPDFFAALKMGRDAADRRVEQSLYRRAVGYSFDSEKIFNDKDNGITRAPCVEHIPPDTVACIFWLKNRRRDEWRDMKAVEHDIGERLTKLADADVDARVAELLRKAGVVGAASGEAKTH